MLAQRGTAPRLAPLWRGATATQPARRLPSRTQFQKSWWDGRLAKSAKHSLGDQLALLHCCGGDLHNYGPESCVCGQFTHPPEAAQSHDCPCLAHTYQPHAVSLVMKAQMASSIPSAHRCRCRRLRRGQSFCRQCVPSPLFHLCPSLTHPVQGAATPLSNVFNIDSSTY